MTPCIFKKDVVRAICNTFPDKNLRLVLSVCDYKFLQKYIDRLVSYEKAPIFIPMIVGVYASLPNAEQTMKQLIDIKVKYSLKKVHFFVFYCEKLEWILSRQQDAEIMWDYKINYIRNARYNLVSSLWNIAGLINSERERVISLCNRFR